MFFDFLRGVCRTFRVLIWILITGTCALGPIGLTICTLCVGFMLLYFFTIPLLGGLFAIVDWI